MDLEAGAPRRAIWAFAALLGSAIAGCHSSAPDDGLALVDYWPAQHLIFVGAKRSAHVDVLRAPSNRTQHGLEFVERLQYPGQKPIVRLVFDRHRVRLWIAAGSEVYIYQYSEDVFTSPQLTKVAVDSARVPISDLTLDGAGNALVHVQGGAYIYRVDGRTFVADKWLELFRQSTDVRTMTTPRNRVVHSRDQRELVFQSPIYGALVKIDIESKKVSLLDINPPTDLTCRVLLWQYNSDSIKAIDCFDGPPAELSINPKTAKATPH